MVFSDPLFRCRKCKRARPDAELGHVKKADAGEAAAYKGQTLPTNWQGNIEQIAYCLDDDRCYNAAIRLAGVYIVR